MGTFETLFHAGPTDAGGSFGGAGSAPVGFERNGVAVAGLLEGFELGGPIDKTFVDRRPDDLAGVILDGVFDVAVMDAVFGESVPAAGEGVEFAAHDGVAWIPVESEVAGGDAGEGLGGLAAGGGVAGELIFENQHDSLLAGSFGGLLQLVVNGAAEGLGVVEAPEVEAADFVSAEGFGEVDGVLEDGVLLLEIGVGSELIALFGVLGEWGAGPVDLEERAGNVGDAQVVSGKGFAGGGYLVFAEGLEVFATYPAELCPPETKVVGDDGAGVVEVFRDFIGDNGDVEGAFRGEGGEGTGGTRGGGEAGSSKEISSREGGHRPSWIFSVVAAEIV